MPHNHYSRKAVCIKFNGFSVLFYDYDVKYRERVYFFMKFISPSLATERFLKYIMTN